MINLRVQAFSLPKAGNQPEEYEDAWEYNEETKRLAIADGASDAINSGLWARALVKAFICKPPIRSRIPKSESILRWLTSPAQVWNEWIRRKNFPWYAEKKAKQGAISTLLGVILAWPNPIRKREESTVIRWQAMAVGDTCLFQIRGDEVIVCFPVKQSSDFDTTPPLLSTRPENNYRGLNNLHHHKGDCQKGDLFVLATDALAEWFLRQIEADAQPWQSLVGLSSEEFAELVERLRQERSIRNDDVTLLLVWVEAQEKPDK